MGFSFKRIYKGINIVPKIGSTSNTMGDLEVDSSTTRLNYHNGTVNAALMTAVSTDTLQNKTIDGNNNTLINIPGSAITGVVPIANGGTGQTTANTALNALLPSQTSNSGKVLITDGTNANWQLNTPSFSNQSANTILAGPTSGGAAAPAFRALVAADIPNLPYALQDLSNLTSTAINQSLVPGTGFNSLELGTLAHPWLDANITTLNTNVIQQKNNTGALQIISFNNGNNSIFIKGNGIVYQDPITNGSLLIKGFVDDETLTANTTSTPSRIQFDTSIYAGVEIRYYMRKGANLDSRQGTVKLAFTSSVVSYSDNYVETSNINLLFTASIVGSFVVCSFNNTNLSDNILARFELLLFEK